MRLERHRLHAARHHDLAVDLVVDLVARAGLREELRERRQRVAGHVDEYGRAIERLDLHLARRSAREQTLADDAQREADFADEQSLGVLIVDEQPDSIALRGCRYRGQRRERGDGDVRRHGLALRGGGSERDDEKAAKRGEREAAADDLDEGHGGLRWPWRGDECRARRATAHCKVPRFESTTLERAGYTFRSSFAVGAVQ